MKKFDETIAFKCRWSEYASELLENWSILWEDSCDDYQGHAKVLAYNNGQFKYLEWYYGSCGGCDMFEDNSDEWRRNYFNKNVMMYFNNANTFINWMKMLQSTNDNKYNNFIKEFSKYFDVSDYLKNPEKLSSKLDAIILLE